MTEWLNAILQEGEHTERLRTDLEYFAKHCLKIRTKAGTLEPLIFNSAQKKLNSLCDEQLRRKGRIRLIVLKARQTGISTFIAKTLHTIIFSPGQRAMLITHERAASRNLYGMIKRYCDNLPEGMLPEIATLNQDEMSFKTESGFYISVAGIEGAGRSSTLQLAHLSEVAYYHDIDLVMASLMQAVPALPGTMVFLESTANSFNQFERLYSRAVAGEGDFEPVFIPWSVDPGYRAPVGADFKPDAEELQLKALYGLDDEQLSWRRGKVIELGERFVAEFPINAQEAFVSASFESFIPPNAIIKARREQIEPHGQLIVGCDPAGGLGGDRTAIAWRRGRTILKVEKRDTDTMQTVAWIAQIIKEEKPVRVNIDSGSMGIAIIDRLYELGHSKSLINAVAFGSAPVEPNALDEMGREVRKYANRRSEIWAAMKKALTEGRFQLPDNDQLQADLASVGFSYRSDGALVLESKADLRKRGVPSPDLGDACALCFCEGDGFVRNVNFRRSLKEQYQNFYY
jgi:hypothetical protein